MGFVVVGVAVGSDGRCGGVVGGDGRCGGCCGGVEVC